MSKDILGHIDCPSCGTVKGMRITHDKNAEPFGFCEAECGQQLRIGGNPRRVQQFVKRHPWAGTVTAPTPAAKPVTVTPTAPPPAPKPVKKPVANPFDFLLNPKATA